MLEFRAKIDSYNEAERKLAQSEGRQPVKGNFEKRIPSSPIGLGMKVEVNRARNKLWKQLGRDPCLLRVSS